MDFGILMYTMCRGSRKGTVLFRKKEENDGGCGQILRFIVQPSRNENVFCLIIKVICFDSNRNPYSRHGQCKRAPDGLSLDGKRRQFPVYSSFINDPVASHICQWKTDGEALPHLWPVNTHPSLFL